MSRIKLLLVLAAVSLLSGCGGDSGNDGVSYYVIVEGSSIGEQQLGEQSLGALVSEPLIDSATNRISLTTRHGAWLTESIQHFGEDHQYPSVEILAAVQNGPGQVKIISDRVFRGAAIQGLTIRSRDNVDAADYEFSFTEEVEGSREGLSLPRSAPLLRAAVPDNRFVQIEGFQGDATVPGLNGALILSSYSIHLFGSGDTQMKSIRLTVSSSNIGLYPLFAAYVEEKANSRGVNTFFSFALSHYSTSTGLLALRYFASDSAPANLNLTSNDDGDEFTFDIIPLFYLVSASEQYDAGGQRTESLACIFGAEDAQNTCPPKPDFFTEQGSVPHS